ncbi:MAG: rod shape-determining protein MreC [Lachnospiraceae bacterium]|nr:rod shape-determining protein MreC [Lachnospiraceae bacterium]
MRRKNKFSIEPKYILIFFVILCIILIITSYKFKDTFAPVRSVAGNVVTPMQKGINTEGTFFAEKTEVFTSMKDLKKKNEKLQKELNSVTYENKILQQEKYELAELRKLYGLDQKYANYPKVAARVIDKDPGNWYKVFKIDKGSKDGLKVNMNVLAGDGSGGGLVGIITEVGHNWAKVRSIVDDTSNVGAMILSTNETCIVSGNRELSNKGLLEFSGLENSKTKISTGAEVVTSYLSDKYHQGILIGYVKEVKVDNSNSTRSGYITPVVDFGKLETVLVITELREALDPKPKD